MKSSPRKGHEVPKLVTPLPGPNAKVWIERDERVISPSYTRDYPLVAARGYGCTIEDVDGNLFLDMTAGIAVTATGHAHPQVVDAIADQAAKLIHMSGTDFYYAAEIELAERLASLAPGPGEKRVFFANSGAEAIEAAIKLSRYHSGRDRIIAFHGAFHGRTYGAMSLGASKAVHQHGFGSMLGGVHRLPYDCGEADFDELFARIAPADSFAAVFVEAIQGEGGYVVPSPDFLPMVRRVCDRHGILLVIDEIQAGMGRTGRWFACEHTGVVPDLLCIAKGVASGMPLGALVAREEIMRWPPGSHASTFGGNPVSCRAALATIDLIEREFLTNAAERGKQIKAGLEELADRSSKLANVRGMGLMMAVDVVDDEGPSPARRNQFVQAAFEQGLLLLGCGRAGVRFCPALCVTAEEIDAALGILRQLA